MRNYLTQCVHAIADFEIVRASLKEKGRVHQKGWSGVYWAESLMETNGAFKVFYENPAKPEAWRVLEITDH